VADAVYATTRSQRKGVGATFGLADINGAIAERLHLVNQRPLRHIDQSRKQLLESIDRPALLPLPEQPFELADWKLAKVSIDYHIAFDHHFYSVPLEHIHGRHERDLEAGTDSRTDAGKDPKGDADLSEPDGDCQSGGDALTQNPSDDGFVAGHKSQHLAA